MHRRRCAESEAGWGANLQAEFGGKPGTDLGAGGQPECDQSITQAIGYTSIRLHQVCKPFRENLARTAWGATDKFAHAQSQDDMPASTGQIRHRSPIVPVDTVRRKVAQRTASGW